MLYKAGETWINGEMNGCSKCKCVTKPGSKSLGFIECIKPSCPRLNCVQQVYPKGIFITNFAFNILFLHPVHIIYNLFHVYKFDLRKNG